MGNGEVWLLPGGSRSLVNSSSRRSERADGFLVKNPFRLGVGELGVEARR